MEHDVGDKLILTVHAMFWHDELDEHIGVDKGAIVEIVEVDEDDPQTPYYVQAVEIEGARIWLETDEFIPLIMENE